MMQVHQNYCGGGGGVQRTVAEKEESECQGIEGESVEMLISDTIST